MTEEEIEIFLDKVSTLAGEYSKAFVFVAIVEDEEGDDRVSYQYDATMCGGRCTALGLLEHAKTKIVHKISSEQDLQT